MSSQQQKTKELSLKEPSLRKPEMFITSQMTLDNESLLDFRIRESLQIIKKAISKSSLVPLIINFSGGKDSLCILDLVQKITDNFICCFTVSGIEFPEAITFVKDSCKRLGRKLLLSTPDMYKGDFFSRLEYFGYFPTIKKRWCSRDLKFRPQKKLLTKLYGKGRFFKLNGVRRFESIRRQSMHVKTPKSGFMLPDYDVSEDIMVFPILNWTNENVREYLRLNRIRVGENPLYQKFGVSGCYWCPFYQVSIYKRIIKQHATLYDRFIEWEQKLNQPSVMGFHCLSDIKKQVLEVGV